MNNDVRQVDETHSRNVARYLGSLLASNPAPAPAAPPVASITTPTLDAEQAPEAVKPPLDSQEAPAATASEIEGAIEEPPPPIQIKEDEYRTQAAPRKPQVASFSHKSRAKGSRQVVMAVLVPVLAVVLVLLIRKPLKGPSTVSAAIPATPSPAVQTAGDVDISWQVPPLYPIGERDPMSMKPKPAASHEEGAVPHEATRENPVVKGVLYSEDRPAAVIGTRLLHVGDKVSGATIVSIAPDGVEFEMDGQRWKQPVSDSD